MDPGVMTFSFQCIYRYVCTNVFGLTLTQSYETFISVANTHTHISMYILYPCQPSHYRCYTLCANYVCIEKSNREIYNMQNNSIYILYMYQCERISYEMLPSV